MDFCKLPEKIQDDMLKFIRSLKVTKEELKNLKITGVREEDIINILRDTFDLTE